VYRDFANEENCSRSWFDPLFLNGSVPSDACFPRKIPLWRSLLLQYLILAGLLFVIQLSSGRKGWEKAGTFFIIFSHPIYRLIYESLGNLIQYLQPDIDPWLMQIDFFHFRDPRPLL